MSLEKIAQLADLLLSKNLMLATAESCTGGLLAAELTELAGASKWFDRSYVTYSYEAKHQLLGVSMQTLNQFGAVSEACVLAMLTGLLILPQVSAGIAISGIAGPDGGSDDKPVGTVWFAFGIKGQTSISSVQHFQGDRHQVRKQACAFAIDHLTTMLQ